MKALAGVEALVFDVYGTLFDLDSLASTLEAAYPGNGPEISRRWRSQQLEYTWLVSLTGAYQNLWDLNQKALSYALASLNLDFDQETLAELNRRYLSLPLHGDVANNLIRLPLPKIILSNGTLDMLRHLLESAGIAPTFSQVISADSVRVYKPHPKVYALACANLGLEPAKIALVSANAFDCTGAKAFGMATIQINRARVTPDTLGYPPDLLVRSLEALAQLGIWH